MKNKNKIIINIIIVAIIIISSLSIVTYVQLTNLDDYVKEGKGEDLFVDIGVNANTGTVPFEVIFTPKVLNSVGDVEYEWDFGDGTTSKEEQNTHVYEETGNYSCTLKVKDKNTEKTSITEIKAIANKPPTVILTVNENIVERKFIPILSSLPLWPGDVQKIVNILEKNPSIFGEGSIVCTAQIDDQENDEIVSYKWVHEVETQASQFFTSEKPIHYIEGNDSIQLPEIYTWPGGKHVVTLTVEDSYGNTANGKITFQVEDSLKKQNRAAKFRAVNSFLNKWLLKLNPLVGGAVAALLLSSWKYNDFTGFKVITLLVLKIVFQLDIGSDTINKQIQEYFNAHPKLKNTTKNSLIKIQDKLRDWKEENPDKNETADNLIETIETLLEDFGMINRRPDIFNPIPVNNAEYIELIPTHPYVYINVSDFEGDNFNISITGDNITDVNLVNQSNGRFKAPLITPLDPETKITWTVKVTDHKDRVVEETYSFTTFWE